MDVDGDHGAVAGMVGFDTQVGEFFNGVTTLCDDGAGNLDVEEEAVIGAGVVWLGLACWLCTIARPFI